MDEAATSSATPAEAERNRALVLRLMAALDRCDVETIRALIASDAVWHVTGIGSMDRETLIAQLEQMLDERHAPLIVGAGTRPGTCCGGQRSSDARRV